MTWFRVDDGFWSHPKTFALSPGAVALWVRAGSYCGNHLTDGVVKRDVLPMLQGTTDHANELINAGLWVDHIDGYLFHDWTTYQDTRQSVEQRRESWRQRQQKHRNSKEKKDKKRNTLPSLGTRDTHEVSRRDTNDAEFDQFWSAYPRKIGKGHARKAWEKAITKTDTNTIIEATIKYRDDPQRDPEYTAHPSTWLNGERWHDEPTPTKQTGPVTVMDQYTEPCEHGDPRGIHKCALCRKAANQ